MLNWILLDITVGAMVFVTTKINTVNKNMDDLLDEADEMIQDIEDEETKKIIEDFSAELLNNPIKFTLFSLFVYLTPILNVLILIENMKEWHDNIKTR